MRIAASPVQQASLSRQAIWWRGDGHPAFNWVSRQDMEGAIAGSDRDEVIHTSAPADGWIASLRSQ
jgi:hypothetical protein